MTRKALRCVHLSPSETRISEITLPEPRQGELFVQSLFSLVSSGTERLVATGQVPPEIQAEMQVPFMEGDFSFPLSYGYSLVGQVHAPGHPLDQRLVHLMHPHQSGCVVPETALFPIPAHVPPRRAVLAANLETALNALWDSQVSAGDRVLLVGFGIIGALLAQVLTRMPGLELHIAETQPQRQALAATLGFQVLTSSPLPNHYDCVFHVSGSEAGLQQAIDAAGPEGRVVELSWYGTQSVSLRLGGAFHSLRKQLISSQVSTLPSIRRPRWDYRRRKEAVFRLLADEGFDALITHEVPFEQLPGFFSELRQGKIQGLGQLVRY